MKTESLSKNIFLSTLYQVLLVVTPFITTPYISRVLGVERIGIYSYTASIQAYFSLFGVLGTASYGTREIAQHREDPEERSRLFWEIELLSIGTSVVVLVAWGVFIAISPRYQIYYLILTLNIINTMLDISWFYSGLEQFKYTIRQNSVFKIAGVVLLFVFVRDKGDLLKYILIMVVTSLLGTVSMWIYLPKFLQKGSLKGVRPLRHLKETFVYFIPTVATSVYTILDKTLIGLITRDSYENGYYEQTTKIVNMIKALTFTSLNMVMGSRISFLFREEKYEEIRRRLHDSIDYICFVAIGCVFGLIAISDRFIPLFLGEEFMPAITMLRLMAPVVAIIGISNCLGSQYYTPAGLRKKSSVFIIIGSIVNLLLNLLLIPGLKANGAIIGTLIAESTITILYIRYSDGYFSFGELFMLAWKKLLAGGVMWIGVRWVMLLFPGDRDFYATASGVVTGVALYVLVLILLKDSSLKKAIGLVRNKLKKG